MFYLVTNHPKLGCKSTCISRFYIVKKGGKISPNEVCEKSKIHTKNGFPMNATTKRNIPKGASAFGWAHR